MSLLRHRGLVFVLAAIALFLVGKNVFWPLLAPKFARRSPAAVPAPVPAPAVARAAPADAPGHPAVPAFVQSVPPPPVDVVPKATVQVQELWGQAAAWSASPQRDPFKFRGAASEKSAREQLTLSGILRQTGSDLAVLNQRVIAVGESILGFRLEAVEPSRVWVSGPDGREMIEFEHVVYLPATPTGGPPVTASSFPDAGR